MGKIIYYANKILIYLMCAGFIGLKKWKRYRSNPREILIISVQHLGESILFLDGLRTLRCFYPADQGYVIRFVGNQGTIDFYKRYSDCRVDEYISLDKEWRLGTRSNMSFLRYLELRKYLNQYNFHTIINPFQNFWGPVLLASLNSSEQYSLYIEGSYGNRISFLERYIYSHMADHIVVNKKADMLLTGYRNLLREIGLVEYQSKIGRISTVCLSDKVREKYGLYDAYCVIVPGSLEKARQWKSESFAGCIEYINERFNMLAVLVGTQSEVEKGNEILCRIENKTRVRNLIASTDIGELMEILSGAEFVFGNDTGTIHLSASLAIPSICVMSYKDVGRCQPYVLDTFTDDDCVPKVIWCESEPECSGCNINSDMPDWKINWVNEECRECVRKENIFKCLKDITQEQVVCKIQEIYSER